MFIYENCIEKAGLDKQQIKSIARRFKRIADECGKIGVQIFGGSTSGSLRFTDNQDILEYRQLILADIPGDFSGGDGACREDSDGYMRGE